MHDIKQSSDEKDLIVNIMTKLSSTNASKITEDGISASKSDFLAIEFNKEDPLWRLASKRYNYYYKNKPYKEWNLKNYLSYIQECLQVYDITLETRSVKDLSIISSLHDKLINNITIVEKTSKDIPSGILKDYIDWYTGLNGPILRGQEIWLSSLDNNKNISMFFRHYKLSKYDITKIVKDTDKIIETGVDKTVDENTLYELGGLPMLLMSKGIVISYNVLKETKESNILNKLINALRQFSKTVLEQVVDKTILNAPYSKKQTVDFLSLARQALDFHKIKKYNQLTYKSFFS